jgi:hypothetical protein
MKMAKSAGLWLFAAVLCFGLAVPALVQSIIDKIRYKRSTRQIREAFDTGAYALDIYGNTTYYPLLNALFLKNGGYYFGADNETVSSALGKNWTMDKLTWLGLGCAGFLNLIDTDHCFKYIKGDWHLRKPERIPWHLTLIFAIILTVTVIIILRCIFLIIFHA